MKIGLPVLFLLLLTVVKVADAQILVGPVAGANYSWVSFGEKELKDEYKITGKYGYHFGAHCAFRVRKRFFLHSSLIYSTKGREMEGKNAFLKYDMTYRYIEMPLVYTAYFKGHLGKKEFKYSLGVGPNISYWLGGKGTIESTDTHEFHNSTAIVPVSIVFNKSPESATQHEVVVQKPTRLQLGLNFTAGFLFEPVPDREIVLTVRYELGHSYLSKESDGAFDPSLIPTWQEPLKVRNQGFRVSLAYLIDLKVENRKKGKSTNDPKKRRY